MERAHPPSPEAHKSFETIFADTIGFASDHPVFTLEDLHDFFVGEHYDLPDLGEFVESFQTFRGQLMAVCAHNGLNPAWYREPKVSDGESLHAFVANEVRERQALTGSLEELGVYIEDVLKDLFQKIPIIASRDIEFFLRYVKGLGGHTKGALGALVDGGLLLHIDDFYMLTDVALAEPIDEILELPDDASEEGGLEGLEPDDFTGEDEGDVLIVPASLPKQPHRRLRVVNVFEDDTPVVMPKDAFLEKIFREAPPHPDERFTYKEREWAKVILNRVSWIAAREDGVRTSVLTRYMIEQMAGARLQEQQVVDQVNGLLGRLWTRQMIARDLSDPEDPRWGLPDADRGQDLPSRTRWPKILDRFLRSLQDPFVPLPPPKNKSPR